MAGNYYRHHHPGGISAVVQYWSEYIERLQYYPTWKLGNVMVRSWWFGYSYSRIALRLFYDKKIKIVHLHFAADGSFWRKEKLLKLGKHFGKKVIMHCHSSRFKDFYNEASEEKKEWIINTLRQADVLIVQWFKSIGIAEERMTVLHNITDYPTIRPEMKSKDGKVHFLFLGEIGKRKGVFDILRGLARNHDNFVDKIEFRIGGNRNEQQLLDTIQKYGLNDIVKFEGWVGGDKKINLLNWADVFILPSFNEGLPISILEAMSYGLPIISGNDGEICSAMKKYVDNHELLMKEGEMSLKIVETYLPEYVMMQLENIYIKLLKQ